MIEPRKRMAEDMKLHGFAKSTQEAYIYAVFNLARFFKKNPIRMVPRSVRQGATVFKLGFARLNPYFVR